MCLKKDFLIEDKIKQDMVMRIVIEIALGPEISELIAY